jgi:uncharacterized iron-regulated membrane protein
LPDLPTLIGIAAGLSLVTGLGLCWARDMHNWFEHRAWHRSEMQARVKLSEPAARRVVVETRPASPPPQLPRPRDDGWAASEQIRFERVMLREECPAEEWIGA